MIIVMFCHFQQTKLNNKMHKRFKKKKYKDLYILFKESGFHENLLNLFTFSNNVHKKLILIMQI